MPTFSAPTDENEEFTFNNAKSQADERDDIRFLSVQSLTANPDELEFEKGLFVTSDFMEVYQILHLDAGKTVGALQCISPGTSSNYAPGEIQYGGLYGYEVINSFEANLHIETYNRWRLISDVELCLAVESGSLSDRWKFLRSWKWKVWSSQICGLVDCDRNFDNVRLTEAGKQLLLKHRSDYAQDSHCINTDEI